MTGSVKGFEVEVTTDIGISARFVGERAVAQADAFLDQLEYMLAGQPTGFWAHCWVPGAAMPYRSKFIGHIPADYTEED